LDFVGRELGKLELKVYREYFAFIILPELSISIGIIICPDKNCIRKVN
jgi:hypothetical protein